MTTTTNKVRAYTVRVGDQLLVDGVLVRLGQFAPKGRRAVVVEIEGDVPVTRIKKKTEVSDER